jgi:SAM-dependent methyltransferase
MTRPASPVVLLNKTYEPEDLCAPAVRAVARRLRWYARRLFLRGVPFAVNGILRRRFYVRRFKMWEYARGLAFAQVTPGMRVLDFGGGATLPVLYLAEQGCDVVSVDINQQFVDYTNGFARAHGVRLSATSHNLATSPIPTTWGTFDRIYSFCVFEHLSKPAQHPTMRKLAGLLRPGGVLVITFDFGPDAPSEWPVRAVDDVHRLVKATGLRLLGNAEFVDAGRRFVLDKRYPSARFTMGAVFLTAG